MRSAPTLSLSSLATAVGGAARSSSSAPSVNLRACPLGSACLAELTTLGAAYEGFASVAASDHLLPLHDVTPAGGSACAR
jgi:hypothetical protein